MKIDLLVYTKGEKLPDEFKANALRTIAFVNEVLASMPNLRFTSGYRTPAHNRRVNGNPHSYHMRASAADFVPRDNHYTETMIARFTSIAARHGFNCFIHNAGSGKHIHSQRRA